MQELIETFHIDWKLMIAQIVNFSIVVLVVWRFALRPIMKTMADRNKTIEKSLEQAKQIENEVSRTAEESLRKINQAKKGSAEILDKAKQQAEDRKDQIMAETEDKMAELVEQTRVQLEQEKKDIVEQAKAQVAEVVIRATSKVIGQKVNKSTDRKLINQSLKDL